MAVTVSPWMMTSVSRCHPLGLTVLLRCRVRCPPPAFPLWALATPLGFVPLQGAPLEPSALVNSSGGLPPRRFPSGPHAPKCVRPGHVSYEYETDSEKSCPSVWPSKDDRLRQLNCEQLGCRPADVSQPAIELFESAFLVLYRRPNRSRWDPVEPRHELQRLARFEVALISRVSCFRAQSLKSFAKASAFSVRRNVCCQR